LAVTVSDRDWDEFAQVRRWTGERCRGWRAGTLSEREASAILNRSAQGELNDVDEADVLTRCTRRRHRSARGGAGCSQHLETVLACARTDALVERHRTERWRTHRCLGRRAVAISTLSGAVDEDEVGGPAHRRD